MIKFKKHKYSVTAIGKFGDSGEIRQGFIIQATSINKEQALQICKILYPNNNIFGVELKNLKEENK